MLKAEDSPCAGFHEAMEVVFPMTPGLSAFSIQPSALNGVPGGGPGALWCWSGGGLTLITQGSDIKRLARLAVSRRGLMCARYKCGAGPEEAR
jgi:hypothetical protein